MSFLVRDPVKINGKRKAIVAAVLPNKSLVVQYGRKSEVVSPLVLSWYHPRKR